MKKRILAAMMILAVSFSLAACSGGGGAEEKDTEKKAEEGAPEQDVVKWNYGTSGNVLVTIANEKGYFEDEGDRKSVV